MVLMIPFQGLTGRVGLGGQTSCTNEMTTMAASPKQIAANRANAARSTGPKTVAGKEAARRNAMTHGLTGRGVVIPGEDEHEVALRVAALEERLVPDGDVLGTLLVRQVAIASIRVERAYRHETALAAERMRRAGDVYDDGRQVLAAEILGELAVDPATARRRLIAAPEGVDALLGRLGALKAKAEPRPIVAWDDADGAELDLCLGDRPDQAPPSRAGMLTRGIVYDVWDGIDPAEYEARDFEARLQWAVGEIHTLITAEIARLEVHRASLDPDRAAKGRSEAAERSLLDLGKDGTALRRYAGAAERTMLKFLHELKEIRREAQAQAQPPSPPAVKPVTTARLVAEVEEVLVATATQPALRERLRAELGSFCSGSARHAEPAPDPRLASIRNDGKTAYVPISVGLTPGRPVSGAS